MKSNWPPHLRIRKRRHFLHIQGSGVRIKSADFIFFMLPSNDDTSRFGLTVSKKVGNAVVRNRIKRLLRESIRRSYHLVNGSFDVVVVAKRSCKSIDYARCDKQMTEFLMGMA